MDTFSTLPVELISNIASFTGDFHTVSALSKTSRHLNDVCGENAYIITKRLLRETDNYDPVEVDLAIAQTWAEPTASSQNDLAILIANKISFNRQVANKARRLFRSDLSHPRIRQSQLCTGKQGLWETLMFPTAYFRVWLLCTYQHLLDGCPTAVDRAQLPDHFETLESLSYNDLLATYGLFLILRRPNRQRSKGGFNYLIPDNYHPGSRTFPYPPVSSPQICETDPSRTKFHESLDSCRWKLDNAMRFILQEFETPWSWSLGSTKKPLSKRLIGGFVWDYEGPQHFLNEAREDRYIAERCRVQDVWFLGEPVEDDLKAASLDMIMTPPSVILAPPKRLHWTFIARAVAAPVNDFIWKLQSLWKWLASSLTRRIIIPLLGLRWIENLIVGDFFDESSSDECSHGEDSSAEDGSEEISIELASMTEDFVTEDSENQDAREEKENMLQLANYWVHARKQDDGSLKKIVEKKMTKNEILAALRGLMVAP